MKLTDEQMLVLRKTTDHDAYWTSDIAYDCRMKTPRTRAVLEALWRRGLVERVAEGGRGLPSSWRRTPAGRAALTQEGER